MIVLGLLLLLLGYLFSLGILETLGWVVLAIGVILLLVGLVGDGIGGRRWWF